MWQWLCFEQYHLEPSIGTVRFWISSLHKTRAELGEKLIEKKKAGYAALDVLEEGLRSCKFLVGEQYSLADIAMSRTRTWRTKAASTWLPIRMCALGATG